jgi:hypothetical protein
VWDDNDGAYRSTVSAWTTAGKGTTFTDTRQSWTTNQFAPGSTYYNLANLVPGRTWFADILSNTANSITISETQTANVGDKYMILGTTSYGSGTASQASSDNKTLYTTETWTPNQWCPSQITYPLGGTRCANGDPYSIRNVTQGWGSEITGNTTNSITYVPGGSYAGPNAHHYWNAGDHYQILRAAHCIDQSARGQTHITLSQPIPAQPITYPQNDSDPIYEWNDTFANHPTNGIIVSNTGKNIANRDYYGENFGQTAQTSPTSPFTGNPATGPGTGWGTLANRPATCTPQVAYWATDQNKLYQCSATDTWTVYYTPYTYPHPLVSTVTMPTKTQLKPADPEGRP